MPWTTVDAVAVELGITVTAADLAALETHVAAANTFAYLRRAKAGHRDSMDTAPHPAAALGTTKYAVARYRSRGAVDGFASYDDQGQWTPTGATWAEIRQLLEVDRPQVDAPRASPYPPPPEINPLR